MTTCDRDDPATLPRPRRRSCRSRRARAVPDANGGEETHLAT